MDGKWCGLNHPLHGKSHTSFFLTFGCMNKFTLPLSITHLVPNLQELSIPLYSQLKNPITYPLTTSNSLELLAGTFFQHIHTNIICSKTNNKHQHSIIIIIIIIPFHARKTPNMTPTPFDVFLQWFTPHLLWQDQDAWICTIVNSEGSKLSLLKTWRRSSLTIKGQRSCLAKWRSNHSCWKRGAMEVGGLKKGLGNWCFLYISRVRRLDDWTTGRWGKEGLWNIHFLFSIPGLHDAGTNSPRKQHDRFIWLEGSTKTRYLSPWGLLVKKLRWVHHVLKLRHFLESYLLW